MRNRSMIAPITSGKLCMSGTSIRNILDGMWVDTIVFMRPKHAAMFAASRAEIPARMFAPKNAADHTSIHPKAQAQP